MSAFNFRDKALARISELEGALLAATSLVAVKREENEALQIREEQAYKAGFTAGHNGAGMYEMSEHFYIYKETSKEHNA